MVQTIWIKAFLSLLLITSTNSCWMLGRFLWTKYKDRLCKPGNTYKNVEEAQAACALQGSDWQGVYDDGCDGRGEAYVCKTKSVAAPDSDSEGWVLKPAAGSSTTFKPKSLTTLKRAVGTFMQGGGWGTATSDAAARSPDNFNDLRSSIRFEKLNKLELTVNFDDLQGSVVYAVRRMGWRLCREGAIQITETVKELNQKVRLVAIAKERDGWEEFTRDYWPPPAEIYFDTADPGYPFFKATNGKNQGVAKMLTSYMFGGEVANNLKRSEHIQGNFKGEGLILGSVMVVSSSGEVLFHHKEKMVGDHPGDDELKAAIARLGNTGVVSCECEDNSKGATK